MVWRLVVILASLFQCTLTFRGMSLNPGLKTTLKLSKLSKLSSVGEPKFAPRTAYRKFSREISTFGKYPQNPNDFPDIATMSDETRALYEGVGLIVDGRWKTDEEMSELVEEVCPGWAEAAWPLGAPDIGHMDAADYLVNPQVGGNPELFPLGAPRVLCFGEALTDLIANSPSVKVGDGEASWTSFPGGAPANVACALAKLGTPAAFIGNVGNDADGDLLMKTMKDAKLPTVCIQRDAERPTRRVYVTRTADGDRAFGGFSGPRDAFADCRFNISRLDGTLLYATDYLVTGTLGLAFPETAEAMTEIRDVALELGVLLVVDVNWRPVFWSCDEDTARKTILEYIKNATFIKTTADEAAWLWQVDRETALERPFKLLRRCPAALGVLVTDGENGCSYAFDKHGARLPAFEVPIVDTTGAGDAFLAGFLHRLINLTDEFQEEMVDYDVGELLPRAHVPTAQRILQFFESKERCLEAPFFASAVGALTCMGNGAIAAQPTGRMAQRFEETYGDDLEAVEESRDLVDVVAATAQKTTWDPLNGWYYS